MESKSMKRWWKRGGVLSCLSEWIVVLVLVSFGRAPCLAGAQPLAGFSDSGWFGEQGVTFRYSPEVRVFVNVPSVEAFDAGKPVGLALYALPNANTIEQTGGKEMEVPSSFRLTEARSPGNRRVCHWVASSWVRLGRL